MVTVVPRGCPAGVTEGAMSRPSTCTCQPSASPSTLLARVSRDTELIAARASPRNPRVPMASRSSSPRILLVAWRDRARGRSSRSMPLPLSRTRTSFTPPCSTSTVMDSDPASSAFSSSSFNTEAGRSTTSPAAIWLARRESSSWIFVTGVSVDGVQGYSPIKRHVIPGLPRDLLQAIAAFRKGSAIGGRSRGKPGMTLV